MNFDVQIPIVHRTEWVWELVVNNFPHASNNNLVSNEQRIIVMYALKP